MVIANQKDVAVKTPGPRLRWLPVVHAMAVLLTAGFPESITAQPVDFQQQVAPILVSRCLECHRGDAPEGGLSLAEQEQALRGGDSGAVLIPGRSGESLLWKRIVAEEMPPRHPLPDAERDIIRRWIDEGAAWSGGNLDLFSITTSTRAGRDWWSLQPLRDVKPPEFRHDGRASDGGNEIDAFVRDRLRREDLPWSPEADPRTLIRRLYFDLIGLPPSPEQVAAFAADPSEAAWQRIVEELLSSAHYGERWGRHWLDVVRYGESDGFERNFARENAWYYRDWVVSALNRDMPYDEFVRMQLIGDLLVGGAEGAAATGFWVAGVHNTVVGGSRRMKLLARQDELEEVLATVGQTFVGLTLNCARCHDHKFDPVTQTEYYQLASAISGLGFGEREIPIPEEQARLAAIMAELAEKEARLAEIDLQARHRILAERRNANVPGEPPPAALARWEFDTDLQDSAGQLHGTAQGNARLEQGALVLDGASHVVTASLSQPLRDKTLEAWVQLDQLDQGGGAAISVQTRDGAVFDAIVFAELEPQRWMPGSNGFVRTDSFGGTAEAEAVNRPVHVAVVYQSDGTITGYRDGVAYGHPVRRADLQNYTAGETEILFGLRHDPPGGNRFLKGRIHKAALYDRALSPEEVAASAGNAEYISEEQIIAALEDVQREHRQTLKAEIAALKTKRDHRAAAAHRRMYTLTPGAGEAVSVLLRGDPDTPGAAVTPGATAAFAGLTADFQLPADAPEADRRRKLAEWLTHERNPLFARVIVNRIWHHHFGTGLVETPNDFGFNGGRPSHPELLDFLALRLQREGYRLKWLHRLIVSSQTWRQSVRGLPADEWKTAGERDASNRLLWRGHARRLEAEALRDAILSVSGQLNPAVGGPGFHDVSTALIDGTTYYEPLDEVRPEFLRRTLYRFTPRGDRSALLDTFDCPDPAAAAPRRSVTTTPLQSLSLMNNALVLRMAEAFAVRVRSEAGDNVGDQVRRAWQLAVSRDPLDPERELSERLVTEHGLAALCRGLFNFNEFVVIE